MGQTLTSRGATVAASGRNQEGSSWSAGGVSFKLIFPSFTGRISNVPCQARNRTAHSLCRRKPMNN